MSETHIPQQKIPLIASHSSTTLTFEKYIVTPIWHEKNNSDVIWHIDFKSVIDEAMTSLIFIIE